MPDPQITPDDILSQLILQESLNGAASVALRLGDGLSRFVERAERLAATWPDDHEFAIGLRVARAFLAFQAECQAASVDARTLMPMGGQPRA